MKIHSSFLGAQEIDPDTIIHFPHGLVGMEEYKDFKLFHEEGKSLVFWLQAVADEAVSFSLCDPQLMNVDYEIRLSDTDCDTLQLSRPEEVAILVMLNRGDPAEGEEEELRANVNGPLLINVEQRRGLQKVLVRPQRHVLLRALDT